MANIDAVEQPNSGAQTLPAKRTLFRRLLDALIEAQMRLLIRSGVLASAQIGKAIISIPLIRSDLALGLDLAGLIVATFATLGAMTGIGARVVVGRLVLLSQKAAG
jgi:hypothetical protein